jgi:hypothetical protein
MGWTLTMSVNVILDQLQDSYGKPNMMMLFNNNTLFQSPMTPTDSPEMIFYHIDKCQEIQHIGKLPYSYNQTIANTIRILFQANIFPLKEFDMWEASATKTCPALKKFFYEAYGQRLTAMALCSTSGKNGYATQNMYNVLEGNNKTIKNTVTTITQTAAAPTTTGLPPLSGRPSMQKLAQQSTNYWQIKWPSCCRWWQCCLYRPQLNILASTCHTTLSRCGPSSRWPSPCSSTF